MFSNNKKYKTIILLLLLCSNFIYSNEIEKCTVSKQLISNITHFTEFSKDDLIVFKIQNGDVDCSSEISNSNVRFYQNKHLFINKIEKYISIEDITVKKKKCYVNLTIIKGTIRNFYLVKYTIRNLQLNNMIVKLIKSESI